MSALVIAVLALFCSADSLRATDPKLQQLRLQLKVAEDEGDKPAVIELSRRIVAIAPSDFGAWEIDELASFWCRESATN